MSLVYRITEATTTSSMYPALEAHKSQQLHPTDICAATRTLADYFMRDPRSRQLFISAFVVFS